eukprot:gene5218-8332_t
MATRPQQTVQSDEERQRVKDRWARELEELNENQRNFLAEYIKSKPTVHQVMQIRASFADELFAAFKEKIGETVVEPKWIQQPATQQRRRQRQRQRRVHVREDILRGSNQCRMQGKSMPRKVRYERVAGNDRSDPKTEGRAMKVTYQMMARTGLPTKGNQYNSI